MQEVLIFARRINLQRMFLHQTRAYQIFLPCLALGLFVSFLIWISFVLTVMQEVLIFARRINLQRMFLDETRAYQIIPLKNIEHAIAVDVDPRDKRVYWSDDSRHIIGRANLDGSGSVHISVSKRGQEVAIQVNNAYAIAVAVYLRDKWAINLYKESPVYSEYFNSILIALQNIEVCISNLGYVIYALSMKSS